MGGRREIGSSADTDEPTDLSSIVRSQTSNVLVRPWTRRFFANALSHQIYTDSLKYHVLE